MKKIIYLLPILLFSCGSDDSTDTMDPELDQRKQEIEEHDASNFTQAQLDREQRSIDYCAENGIDIPESLPCIYGEDEITLRDKQDVVDRCYALCYGGLKSEQMEQADLDRYDEKYDVVSTLTPKELVYAEAENPDQQQAIDANWKYEGLHVLLWALSYIDTLYYPNIVCDVAADVEHLFSQSKEEFYENAVLRSPSEILDMNDRLYRMHWACVDNRINGKPAPGALDEGIVYEWHYALNWLIGYMNQDWDDVTTDT